MMNAFLTRLYVAALVLGGKAKAALRDERGDTNIISIIVILAIVLALAIIFRDNINKLFTSIWNTILNDTDKALGVNQAN